MANTPATVVLRLDRSKKFSTVHGERGPDDPCVNVQYVQDGLPYDFDGILVPDNGQTTPVEAVVDGQRTRFFPLYNEDMRQKLKRKLERAAKGQVDTTITEDDDDTSKEDASEDVNIESWLRGEIKYPPFMIFAACKRRFSKSYTRIRDVIDDLVVEMKLIPESQVDQSFLKMITDKVT